MAGPLTRPEFALLDTCRQKTPSSQRTLADITGLSLGYVNQTSQRLRASGLLAPDSSITQAGLTALEPYRVTNAIIMAAGMSTRFAPVSYEKPKGLLVVKGEVLIERQIRQLREAGIKDITVVVGYRQEQFFYLEDEFGVAIIVNPDYRERNNHSTIKVAESILDNTYICSADNYFTENVFEPYVYQAYYAAVWQDGPTDEWGLVASPTGRIIEARLGMPDTWTMMGHAYWDRDFSLRFRAILNAVYDRQETMPKLWEAIYAEHTTELALQLRAYPPGVIWEFDTMDDLREFDPTFVFNIDSAILDNICGILKCQVSDLSDFTMVVGGLTNLSVRFTCNGQHYVYRHPGVATHDVLSRAAEAQAEAVASKLGVDSTFIYMDPVTGWKISRFVDNAEDFDYHNREHIGLALTAIRKLHTQGDAIDTAFDLFAQATELLSRLSGDRSIDRSVRLGFPELATLRDQAQRVNALSKADAVEPVLCHNDFYAPNILIADGKAALIDWEYAGMGDPAGDLGTFICCSNYTWEEVQAVFTAYFGRPPTPHEKRHYTANVALAAYYWWVWSLYKDACGDSVGTWSYLWYKYTKEYGRRALDLYAETDVTLPDGHTDSPKQAAVYRNLPAATPPRA